MEVGNIYNNITSIVEFNLESKAPCQECGQEFNNVAEAVNHYISSHNYRLLNIGTQSSIHNTGDLVHDIIAHLGK